jgi:CheY-like chemotaxis protein
LIIEDDAFKLDRIRGCLSNLTYKLSDVSSLQAAVTLLAQREFDFVLLDMALPSHDLKRGGGPSASMLSGGIEVIMELAYQCRNEKVIVITQYPEIEIEGALVPVGSASEKLRKIFGGVISVIHYKHESQSWEADLRKLLE